LQDLGLTLTLNLNLKLIELHEGPCQGDNVRIPIRRQYLITVQSTRNDADKTRSTFQFQNSLILPVLYGTLFG
jgi:hypothetical protein